MARSDDLRGYALKRKLNLVPFPYPPRDRMRGVFPPITPGEAYRIQADAAQRRGGTPARGKAKR